MGEGGGKLGEGVWKASLFSGCALCCLRANAFYWQWIVNISQTAFLSISQMCNRHPLRLAVFLFIAFFMDTYVEIQLEKGSWWSASNNVCSKVSGSLPVKRCVVTHLTPWKLIISFFRRRKNITDHLRRVLLLLFIHRWSLRAGALPTDCNLTCKCDTPLLNRVTYQHRPATQLALTRRMNHSELCQCNLVPRTFASTWCMHKKKVRRESVSNESTKNNVCALFFKSRSPLNV